MKKRGHDTSNRTELPGRFRHYCFYSDKVPGFYDLLLSKPDIEGLIEELELVPSGERARLLKESSKTHLNKYFDNDQDRATFMSTQAYEDLLKQDELFVEEYMERHPDIKTQAEAKIAMQSESEILKAEIKKERELDSMRTAIEKAKIRRSDGDIISTLKIELETLQQLATPETKAKIAKYIDPTEREKKINDLCNQHSDNCVKVDGA